jgi:hypothetical protein
MEDEFPFPSFGDPLTWMCIALALALTIGVSLAIDIVAGMLP